ncbi:hypothetical protein [Aquimarina aquimarini]|uniref:hypothetical protein n=1 Tax=Aquimarina aquimarini TaxID=1191734 RepID=UPI000D561CF4|nr:hypothetical protein [Aquimarina aquimarini]
MTRIKKIHKIILLFVFIFLLGIYSFTLYINNTIDHKKESIEESEINTSTKIDREASQIN